MLIVDTLWSLFVWSLYLLFTMVGNVWCLFIWLYSQLDPVFFIDLHATFRRLATNMIWIELSTLTSQEITPLYLPTSGKTKNEQRTNPQTEAICLLSGIRCTEYNRPQSRVIKTMTSQFNGDPKHMTWIYHQATLCHMRPRDFRTRKIIRSITEPPPETNAER